MFRTHLFVVLLCVVTSKAKATIRVVKQGDPQDLLDVLERVENFDTVLIPAGDYIYDSNLCKGYQSVDLCGYLNRAPISDGYVLIKGLGSNRRDTILTSAIFRMCHMNMVVENLSVYTLDDDEPFFYGDNDVGTLFKNTFIQVSPYDIDSATFYNRALLNDCGKLSLMYTRVEVNPPVPGISQKIGLDNEFDDVVVIGSEFAGFVEALKLGDDLSEYAQIDNNDLSRNVKETSNSTAYDLLTPNTPKGKNVVVQNLIDILRYGGKYCTKHIIFLGVKIKIKKVTSEGETTIYRVPSAYPIAPLGYVSAPVPQYYQFDSTAKLGKRATVYFNKTVIDRAFTSPSPTISVSLCFDGHNWDSVDVKNKSGYYKFQTPKDNTHLNFLAAFFDQPDVV